MLSKFDYPNAVETETCRGVEKLVAIKTESERNSAVAVLRGVGFW